MWLVQTGDYLEINGGGVYVVAAATSPTTLMLGGSLNYSGTLLIPSTSPTANYRIIRQPRILIGEEPLAFPANYAANWGGIPGSASASAGSNIPQGVGGNFDILFSPSGAVVGSCAANGLNYVSVWDSTLDTADPARVGIIGIQSRSGFIGAYDVGPPNAPFQFLQTARESGL